MSAGSQFSVPLNYFRAAVFKKGGDCGILYQAVQMNQTGGVLVIILANGKVSGTESFFVFQHFSGDAGRGIQADAQFADIAGIARVNLPAPLGQFSRVFKCAGVLFGGFNGTQQP